LKAPVPSVVAVKIEKGKNLPQGLKPALSFAAFAARLKSCPDTSGGSKRVFPQPVKPCFFKAAKSKSRSFDSLRLSDDRSFEKIDKESAKKLGPLLLLRNGPL
jgi:hypothetical protein